MKFRTAFHLPKAYEAEAEAVEMCKDIALTARIGVLEPGASQHTLLLQDCEAKRGKGGKGWQLHQRLIFIVEVI